MKTQDQLTTAKTQDVVTVLNQLLADYQIYYQNLRGLHWNVTGNMFFSLHEKYENYYNEAAEVVDQLAERILTIGGKPAHTFADYLSVSGLKELDDISDGKKGVEAVLENSKYLLGLIRRGSEVASAAGDEGTVALLSELTGSTEKRIWMLTAFLK
jgi:starvation-inducible DNA-binding protein